MEKISCPFCNSRKVRLQYSIPREDRMVCNDCLRNWNQIEILKRRKQTILKKLIEIKKRELENDLY